MKKARLPVVKDVAEVHSLLRDRLPDVSRVVEQQNELVRNMCVRLIAPTWDLINGFTDEVKRSLEQQETLVFNCIFIIVCF